MKKWTLALGVIIFAAACGGSSSTAPTSSNNSSPGAGYPAGTLVLKN